MNNKVVRKYVVMKTKRATQWIKTTIIDEDGNEKSREEKIDIEGINTKDEMEREVEKISKRNLKFLLWETLKKSKMPWWRKQWKRVKIMCGMGLSG